MENGDTGDSAAANDSLAWKTGTGNEIVAGTSGNWICTECVAAEHSSHGSLGDDWAQVQG